MMDLDKVDRIIVLVWALMFVLAAAFWVGVIYVILHFLAKVW